MCLSLVMVSQWIARGLFLQAALLTLLFGVGIVANLVVIPSHGTRGATWVTVGCYMASLIGNAIMALWVEARVRSPRRRGVDL